MAKFIRKATGLLLAVVMAVSGFITTVAAATNSSSDTAQIESTNMTLDAAKSNVEKYFSNDDWTEAYPNGLFVVEYSSYQVTEGGEDSDNPGDFYLGIVIYRLGGNASSATVNYSLTCYSGDSEMYPASIGSVEFEPQAEIATAKIKIKNDDKRNGEQVLIFTLTGASTGEISSSSSAGIKIIDDEPFVQSAITMSTEKAVTDKSDGNVSLVLKRSENSVDYCTLHIKTEDGTAKSGVDYEAVDQMVIFAPNQTEKTVAIPLIQTKEKFTDKKSFIVTMDEFKACYPKSEETIRIDITNNLNKDDPTITMVDDMKADIETDDGEALTDSAISIVNKNDTLDRAQLLRSVIGIANGTSSAVMPKTTVFSNSDSYWLSALTLTADDFEHRYSTGDSWVPNKEYNDGNEDLLVVSKNGYNLNYFSSVKASFANHQSLSNGAPNTAFGYLTASGVSDVASNDTYANLFKDLKSDNDIKTTIYNGSDRAKNKMKNNEFYILLNKNNENIDVVKEFGPLSLKTSDGQFLPESAGIDGASSKLFFMLYDDQNWDDHHFDLSSATLVRAVVPFSVFDTGDNDFEVNINSESISASSVSFVQDNIKWTVKVDTSKGGGVGPTGTGSTNAEKYGFYVGSNLKITYDMSGGDTSINRADPQFLYITDQDGNIHNSAKVTNESSSYFSVPFETVMSGNKEALKNSYYMTNDEAQAHINNTLGADEAINQDFNKKLTFKVGFALRQQVQLNFSNLPYLVTAKSNETADEHEDRVIKALDSVVTFYSDSEIVTPSYKLYLEDGVLAYESIEFDSITVDPKKILGDSGEETDCKATSNLYDKDYELFSTAQNIPYEVCSQIDSAAVFTFFSGDTDYLLPQITLDETSVSEKTEDGFNAVYTANPLDDSIPFEALYGDTASSSPDYTYYTMKFTISDIYIGSNKGVEKDFNVNVIRQKTDGLESDILFSFTFKGGVHYSEPQDVTPTYKNEGIFKKDEFNPYLQLLDDSNGYEYIMYIPSYYSYQDLSSEFLPEHIFHGGDGIRIEIESPDSETKEIITALDVSRTPYVRQKLISAASEAEAIGAEDAYFEEQKNFYTMNSENSYVGATGAKVDFTNMIPVISKLLQKDGDDSKKTGLSKLLSRIGVTVKFTNNQIMIIGKIKWWDKDDDSYETVKNPETETDSGSGAKAEDENIIKEAPLVNADPNNTTEGKSNVNTGSKIAESNTRQKFTVSGFVEARVQLDYNTVTNQYVFTKLSMGLSTAVAFSKALPIAACPIFYITFSTSASVYASYTMKNVQDYIDENGNVHYKLLYFGGFAITPAIAISAGVGVGISGILSFDAGVSAELIATVNIAQQKYTPAQREYDVNSISPISTSSCGINFRGYWHTFTTENDEDSLYQKDGYYTGSYNNSLCQAYVRADAPEGETENVMTVSGCGTSFQLTGSRNPTGGLMEINIYGENGAPLADTAIVDMRSSEIKLYDTLYEWHLENYTKSSTEAVCFQVVIKQIARGELISGETYENITLDSIRIYDPSKANIDTAGVSLGPLSFRLGMTLTFSVIGITLTLQPAYMLVVWDGTTNVNSGSLTLGTLGYSYTWKFTDENENSIPTVMATANRAASLTSPDYFDTGEFSSTKSKTLLQEDVSNVTKTQVVYHNDNVYSFYTLQEASGYKLYYSKNDESGKAVTDDIYTSDFNAFEDSEGNLRVEIIASDSTVKSFTKNDDGTATLKLDDNTNIIVESPADLSEALKRTCVKIAKYDDDSETFANVSVIEGTDGDGVQDSLPACATGADLKTGSADSDVIFFVKDTLTDKKAEYDLNGWTCFDGNGNDEDVTETMQKLMDSLYSGQAKLCYSILKDGEYSEAVTVELDEVLEAQAKEGFKIMNIDAVMADENTVCVAYSIELPHSTYGGRYGTLKQIHYRTATFNADKTALQFSDTVVIDSVFDYNENITDVFENTDEIPSCYYNAETDEYYDSIILNQVQLENAVLCENGTKPNISNAQPCLFYKTNKSINYVTYDTLSQAVENKTSGDDSELTSGILYDDYFDNYIIAVASDGSVNLIFNDPTNTSSYTDTLYITEYNSYDKVWNKPRQLTYSDAFNQEAYDNREETGSVRFENYSAFIDKNGKVSIALKSSYAPFSYDYIATEETLNSDIDVSDLYDYSEIGADGTLHQGIVTPILDYKSDKARCDVFMITFEDMVDSIDVAEFELQNKIFVNSEYIEAAYSIYNNGDYMQSDFIISLYYRDLFTNTITTLVTDNFTGTLLSGDTYVGTIGYTVGEETIPDNTMLGIRVINSVTMKTLYDSYTDSYLPNTDTDSSNDTNITYHIINNSAELYFDGMNIEIDSKGILNYKVNIVNAGTVDITDDIDVKCNSYKYNEETGEFDFVRTMFTFTVNSDELTAGSSALSSDSFNVAEYLIDGELYYNFEIVTKDKQYDADNDIMDVAVCQQTPEIKVESIKAENVTSAEKPVYSSRQNVRNMTLGDEITINTSVVSDYYTNAHLRFYEIGSSCLSIDDSSSDGSVKIKAVSLPEDGAPVKLLINITGTVIYRIVYLYISDTDSFNFDESCTSDGWILSNETYVYASNFDVLTTDKDSKEFEFAFTGKDLKIYGNKLTDGGSFKVSITDSNGNTVVEESVSTASELRDCQVLLFKTEKLDYDSYNVKITSQLKDGQRLELDCAKYTIDTSNVDTEGYAKVRLTKETLDAPLLSGRARVAEYRLNFTKNIELAENKKLEDITLTFDEYKGSDDTFTATGNTVVFTASEIRHNRTLVFTSELSSEPGYIMKYVLHDSQIPDGCIVTASGTPVECEIPDYEQVSYTLKESGIMSVTVADDQKMPNGSVHKSVNVKFITEPDTSRLEGTKLLYITNDSEGKDSVVEFNYAEMTADSKTAVYRADSLELGEEEMSKTFSFEKGIVLNESNYVLVTAEGDYLENDITTVISDKEELDITYNKLKSSQAPMIETTTSFNTDGKAENTPVMYVRFDDGVDISKVIDDQNAYVTINEAVTDNATNEVTNRKINLYISHIIDQSKTLVFSAKESTLYEPDKTVEYTLISDRISYTDSSRTILCKSDKISINPELSDAEPLIFGTSAYIIKAEPYFEGGSIKPINNNLFVDVTFSSTVNVKTLENTTITVNEYINEYNVDYSKELVLKYDSVRTQSVENGSLTVATYKYSSDTDDISFTYDEIAKRFEIDGTLGIPQGESIKTADNELTYSEKIIYRGTLEAAKAQANKAEIRLVPTEESGYGVELDVHFEDDIMALDTENAYAVVNMKTDDESKQILLPLDKVENNTLKFVSENTITLNAGEIVTFTLKDRFTDSRSVITDKNGIGVSEIISNLTELVQDMSEKGNAASALLTVQNTDKNKVTLVGDIIYDEVLREKSFNNSKLNVNISYSYSDGKKGSVEQALEFEKLLNENTARYTAEIEIPADADSALFVLGESIVTEGNNKLHNENRTLALSCQLPESRAVSLSKTAPISAAIVDTAEKDKLDSLNSTAITLTYPEKISAENINSISLKANVTGVEGVSSIEYIGKTIDNENTLVLIPVNAENLKLANVVEISLNGAVLEFKDGAELFSNKSTFAVSTAVPNVSQKFIVANGSIAGSQPTTTPTEPVKDDTQATTPSETSPTSETVATTENDKNTTATDSTAPTTGQTAAVSAIAAIMIAAFAALVAFRKKKTK